MASRSLSRLYSLHLNWFLIAEGSPRDSHGEHHRHKLKWFILQATRLSAMAGAKRHIKVFSLCVRTADIEMITTFLLIASPIGEKARRLFGWKPVSLIFNR